MTALIEFPEIPTQLIQLVLDGLSSPQSKRAYSQALTDFLRWYARTRPADGLCKATVQQYRSKLLESGISASTVNLRLCAIRKLAEEAEDNNLLDKRNADGIRRVKGVKKEGVRTGNWLTVKTAESLLGQPDITTLRGKRDRALLSVLIGCGLRRDEAARLKRSHIQQRDARWVIVDLVGKGNRTRTVPMPAWAKLAVDVWLDRPDVPRRSEITTSPVRSEITIAPHSETTRSADHQPDCVPADSESLSGAIRHPETENPAEEELGPPEIISRVCAESLYVFRPVDKGDNLRGDRMTPQAVFQVVRKYCERAGLGRVAPHDLRRTFAKLAHQGHAAIEQIQLSLGHASIQTTERYLGVHQDLIDAPCDRLGIKPF